MLIGESASANQLCREINPIRGRYTLRYDIFVRIRRIHRDESSSRALRSELFQPRFDRSRETIATAIKIVKRRTVCEGIENFQTRRVESVSKGDSDAVVRRLPSDYSFASLSSPLLSRFCHCCRRVGSIESANNLLRLLLGAHLYALIDDRAQSAPCERSRASKE